jgi:MarR family transcriptional regulator, organic hydroperoxide resistance regulator
MENSVKEAEKFRYLILAIQRQGNRIYKDLLFKIGVTPSQAEVISILMKWQPISLKDLGGLLVCETGSPSRLIERMVKDQLVERVKDVRDSRFVRLQLTSIGIEKYKLITKEENELYKMLEHFYTNDELEFTNHILSKFLMKSPLSSSLSKRGYIHKSDIGNK